MTTEFNYYNQVLKSPLCGFCLSPPFSIRTFTSRPFQSSTSRRLSVRSWRRGGSSLPSVPPRFKPHNRRSFNSLIPKYLADLLVANKHKKTLTLTEVLDEIQKVWTPCKQRSENSCFNMDERLRKTSSVSHNEISPILLRRRLSAPETIMRKHMLAQQRSGSQDSEITQSSEARSCQWRSEMDAGSDSNLNRKRDPDLMRKSTLLRRLWSHTKPAANSRFTGTFYEWQHSSYSKMSSGKSTHSLTSLHSSPEHLVRSQSKRSLNAEFRTSPQHKHHLKKSHDTSPKRKISIYSNTNSNFDSYITTFSEITPGSSTNTPYTTFSEHSDSAYTNSASNYSSSSINNNNSTPSEIYKSVIEETDVSNQEAIIQTDSNLNSVASTRTKCTLSESSVQTTETTNVNVISNVELSQSTLDLIFNHVMQDVRKTLKSGEECNVNNQTIQVQKIQSFNKNIQSDDSNSNRVVKYMISNVGTGTSYSKPTESPQVIVPRFSALPRTSSMEVNIASSGDSTDKESDCVSLVDSLEDESSSIRHEFGKKSDKLSPPLPDNSDKTKTCKPTAFYIPIEVDNQSEFKAVSDHLPEKVRNKLAKRQQKRQEKIHVAKSKNSSSRSDSNYISASDNGNQFSFVLNNGPDVNLNGTPLPQVNYNYNNRAKKRNKPLLPSIETFRKTKGTSDQNKAASNKRESKPIKRKDNSAERVKMKHNISKDAKKKTSPTYSSRNEYVYDYGPRRIYHKTEFDNENKRIEILQIMECVETSDRITQQLSSSRSKSKIPILIHQNQCHHHHQQRLPKINQQSPSSKTEKPTFLDLDGVQITDPKLDQLIANLLIETLNNSELKDQKEPSHDSVNTKSQSTSKFQKFEPIPEEISLKSSSTGDDKSNNNHNNDKDASLEKSNLNAYQGKAAVAVVRDENFSSIPKGWITFYMLHKNRGSPDSTSDEGKNCRSDLKNIDQKKDTLSRTERLLDQSFNMYEQRSSSSENQIERLNNSNGSRNKKINNNNNNTNKRYLKSKAEDKFVERLGEWSVTVSGTNSYGQQAPNLEMSLKFQDNKKKTTNNSNFRDNESEHSSRINNNTAQNEPESENSWRTPTRLPEIPKNKICSSSQKEKRSASSSLVQSLSNSVTSRIIEPRQTKTSTRRYNLSRPKVNYSLETGNTMQLFDERRYAEILRRFPEILSITGNAVSPQDKK